MQKTFFRSLLLLIFLNLLVKPVWIFGIDRQVQNITGFAEYGEYFALLNLSIVFNFLLDLGITSYFNQQVASGAKQKEGFFSKVIVTKLILSAIYTATILAIATVSGITDWTLIGLLILLQILTSFLLLARAYLTATQHYARDAAISVADKLIVIIVVGTAIIVPSVLGEISIHFFVTIQVCAVAISIISALALSVREFVPVKFSFRGIAKDILIPSTPFALNIFFMSLMARGDSFLLDRLHPQGATEAGIYASSFRLLDAFNMVGFLFAGFLLPYIARHKDDRESVDSVMIACRNLLLLFTFISASFIIWAPWFVNSILYHQTNEYREWVLRLTIMNLPFLALIHIYGTALTATGHIKTYFRITIFFAIINFCANILLAGRYGAIACAAIACCTQLLFALTIIYFSLKKTRAPIQWFSLGKIVLAAIIFCLILGITGKYGWNPVFSGMIALLLTGLILLFTGTISIGRILKTVTEN